MYDAEPQPYMGSLISEQAAQGILKAQQNLQSMGAEPLLAVKQLEPNTGLLSPGIIDVSSVKDLPDEEYFGPLLQIIRYRELDEAIEGANNTRFGLSAGLVSDDRAQWEYFLQRSRAGIVNWNKPLTGASGSAPFGGSVPAVTTGPVLTMRQIIVPTRSPRWREIA